MLLLLNCSFVFKQGVMKVRKRVTLMVVTITALFSICWLTDTVVHVVEDNTSYIIDKNVYTVIHTMILFSSAANPFVYALLNQTFREKIKKVMFCTRSTAAIPPATQDPHAIESAEETQPTQTARLFFMEWCATKCFLFYLSLYILEETWLLTNLLMNVN